MIGVPFARAVNPISKTNWEGTGVEPDVKVPAEEALEVTKKMAAGKSGTSNSRRNRLAVTPRAVIGPDRS